MLMGDILTLRQQKLPAKIVIFNNGTLGFVEMEMKAAGYVETGVALDNPDFAAMANAIGIFGVRVEDPGDLAEAAERVLAHKGPALLDVVTARNELSMPPKLQAEQVKGFSLYVMRAVMSGRGRFCARPGEDEPDPVRRSELAVQYTGGSASPVWIGPTPTLPLRNVIGRASAPGSVGTAGLPPPNSVESSEPAAARLPLMP